MKKTIHWAENFLQEYGYKINSPFQVVQDTPYSYVVRFETDRGFVYLKEVPPALALEPSVIKVLHEQFNAQVPIIISDNQKEHSFLMQDSGIRLHDFFSQNGFQAKILIETLQHYTKTQIDIASKVPIFLAIGVPDWRLTQLPKHYQALISDEDLLLHDGLTKDEVKKLSWLNSKLVEICEQLSDYNIPDTFGHGDFHDKNILVNPDTHKTTIIDLGEVVITHPFFSLLNCIHRVKENCALSDNQYAQLKKDCLSKWLAFESQTHIFEILSLIEKCWSIHAVLGEYRLMQSVDQKAYQDLRRQGRLSKNLRYWIAENK